MPGAGAGCPEPLAGLPRHATNGYTTVTGRSKALLKDGPEGVAVLEEEGPVQLWHDGLWLRMAAPIPGLFVIFSGRALQLRFFLYRCSWCSLRMRACDDAKEEKNKSALATRAISLSARSGSGHGFSPMKVERCIAYPHPVRVYVSTFGQISGCTDCLSHATWQRSKSFIHYAALFFVIPGAWQPEFVGAFVMGLIRSCNLVLMRLCRSDLALMVLCPRPLTHFCRAAAAYAARPLFMGKPVDEETLRDRYTYLEEVRKNQRAQLQELLDAAKQGECGRWGEGRERTERKRGGRWGVIFHGYLLHASLRDHLSLSLCVSLSRTVYL